MFESVFIGFLARKVAPRPSDFLARAPIDDVCSVSECISPGAPDRIQRWAHNAASFYDTEALAWSVVPDAECDAYTLFAYRAVSIRFDGGDGEPWSPGDEWPGLPAEPDLSAYAPIGYDVVRCSVGAAFDCSPLSCNGVANEHAVNEHCLVDDVDVAMQLGRAFTAEGAGVEPGPYHVVEVLRRIPTPR
jgi:hypothetical protein